MQSSSQASPHLPTTRYTMECPQSIPPQISGSRDARTFAQVITGNSNKRTNPSFAPIELKPKTFMSIWMSKSVLIMDAHSLDHIGNLSTTILTSENTKYSRGLNIAIRFSHSDFAKEYLDDTNRWRDWFKWLVQSDQQEIKYERTASIKILGVPLNLWDEVNFP